MLYLGIDPGLDGGICALSDHGIELLIKIPTRKLENKKEDMDLRAILSLVMNIISSYYDPHKPHIACALERVSARPGQGVTSMFRFGDMYGRLQGMLEALFIPYVLVSPQKWKNQILKGTAKDKAAAIKFVQDNYPDVSLLAKPKSRKPHDGMADAVCIAHYARWYYPSKKGDSQS